MKGEKCSACWRNMITHDCASVGESGALLPLLHNMPMFLFSSFLSMFFPVYIGERAAGFEFYIVF